MVALPQAIETALQEAGFSPTEILILNHLLEEEGMTLREIASKTGKSTGVLDQAMKKLLRRHIVERHVINDTPKYIVGSLQSIVDWMENDTQKRREELDRRYSNFESFILTLERERSRPHVEHFDGLSGIKQAYEKLLEYGEKDIVGYVPVSWKEEEDPLREFKVQWFRDRYKKGIFLRILAHDTPLGRRFQSRDAFEYRKSILVDPASYPFNFEKYIVNNTLACIDFNKRSAMFLHYPEMVKTEKDMFERLWQKKLQSKTAIKNDAVIPPIADEPEPISPYTRVVSLLREFFVGPKSLVAMGICAVMAAIFTYGIYQGTVRLNIETIRQKVTAIATTATVEFDSEKLIQLRNIDDVKGPIYKEVVSRLQEIRRRNSDIFYVYLIRPNPNNSKFEFIADADAVDPDQPTDTNEDGVINDADTLGFPGVPYEVSYIDVLANHEYAQPTATHKSYTDKWGTFFSGYAPIKNAKGEIVALLCIDMTSASLKKLTSASIQPIIYFLILFIIFIIFRLAAFNRPILKQLIELINMRKIVRIFIVFLILSILLLLVSYKYTLNQRMREVGQKAMAIAATAAPTIDFINLDKIKTKDDMKKPEYQIVFNQLNKIRKQNPDVKYAYIFRSTDEDGIWEFIADADSNFDSPHLIDMNSDGVLSSEDEISEPGKKYNIRIMSPKMYQFSLKYPLYDEGDTPDQWGVFVTGTAPILDDGQKPVAVLGIDYDLIKVRKMVFERFLTTLKALFLLLFTSVIFSVILLNIRPKIFRKNT